MSYLRGKNTLSALEVTLSEIYSLRRSGSNTIPLQDVDEHLSNRPDYIIWRLLRERNAHTSLSLPKGIKGGKELLLSSLTDAANHSDLDVKWTAYSLISLGLLRMASVEEPLRFIRAPCNFCYCFEFSSPSLSNLGVSIHVFPAKGISDRQISCS